MTRRMRIAAMTPAFARDIVTWHYDPPYDYYDMTGTDPAYLTEPASGFFALLDPDGLIGFRSFGADGQVPGGRYDASALDTGGGLCPELTGKGLGREAIGTGLAFGRRRFAPAAFRVTIASFNLRARRLVESLGFRAAGGFLALAGGQGYEMLVRPERRPAPAPGGQT